MLPPRDLSRFFALICACFSVISRPGTKRTWGSAAIAPLPAFQCRNQVNQFRLGLEFLRLCLALALWQPLRVSPSATPHPPSPMASSASASKEEVRTITRRLSENRLRDLGVLESPTPNSDTLNVNTTLDSTFQGTPLSHSPPDRGDIT